MNTVHPHLVRPVSGGGLPWSPPGGGVSIVIPTVGRPSLDALLRILAREVGDGAPVELVIVRDRPVEVTVPPALRARTRVLAGRGAGPAAARNVGWRNARHPWVAFLDDDVLPRPGWLRALLHDLTAPDLIGGVLGRIEVPLPHDRRPTDWERCTAGLETGRWITADMAYRRDALAAAGGFDERFPRAYREDAELAFRVRAAGWQLRHGMRRVRHPVRPEDRWVSVRTQRGNADDALLRRLYGPRWRQLLEVPRGRRTRHTAITALGVLAVACGAVTALTRRPAIRRAAAATCAASTLGWAAGTGEFALARIRPGPPQAAERLTMIATSVLIPPVATYHWLRGWFAARGARMVTGARRAAHRDSSERPDQRV
ncbi:transferase [Catellatospora bangladeshensis]|uniref:Transferase n=1 Tax=Catellatospora bangladeshensis TaxID=310355 RepID=A0A8J3JHW5_9ACTN|nr:transferase [Catellatospora bangladeshensis]